MHQAGAQPPHGLKENLSEGASHLKEQAGTKARQVAEQARSAADQGKDQLAAKIGDVAQAFHRTGDQLRSDEQESLSQFTDAIGSQVERVASFLQGRDVRSMVSEVENFARRQPALFLGGAFTLGLFAARFLKSSAVPPQAEFGFESSALDYPGYGSQVGSGAQSGYGNYGTGSLEGSYGGSGVGSTETQGGYGTEFGQGSFSGEYAGGGQGLSEQGQTGQADPFGQGQLGSTRGYGGAVEGTDAEADESNATTRTYEEGKG